jgi:two-component system sensor histidine kinase CiaH
MRLFDAAYIRLTVWYVAIIMSISLLFSVWVYNQARNELQFGLDRIVHVGPRGIPADTFAALIEERLDASRRRVILRLVSLNVIVLAVGAGASYWLARRTMQPIEEAMEAQDRFTADASHELRTPLAAMKAEIEVGLRDKKLTKDEAVELLESNLEEIDRLGNLAEGLLALTQDAGPYEPLPIALDDVSSKVIKRMRPLGEAKKISLQAELNPVVAAGNEIAIDKIAGILIDNAIKYSQSDTTITVRTYQKDGYGCLEVTDQGIGIKATELPHIFDRFYRADTSRSKQHVPGHGLGLSIAQRLAEQMEGTITAASRLDRGSTFTLRLPVNV